MKPLYFLPACSVICLLAISVSRPIASGQQANLTAEKRASLIAERDAIGNGAIAAANAGQLEDAGEKMARVYEIERALFGDVDVELMGTLSWQAKLAQAAKKWDQEIEFRKRAFTMAQELYGKEDYRSLDLQRELNESQANASRTTEQRRKIAQASKLNREVGALYKQGRFEDAINLAKQAKILSEQTLGKQHHSYAYSLNNLAGLYKSMGDYARAEPLYRKAVEITVNHLEQTSLIQSEQQQMLMLRSVRHQLDNYLRSYLEGGLGQRNAVAQIVDWKGSILVRQRGLRLAADDPSIADQFRQLQSGTSQISAVTRSVPDPQLVDTWKKRLERLSSTKRELESELMRLNAPFKEAKQRASFAEFQASIPEGGVVVDYLEYNGKQGRSLLASVIHRDGDPIMLDVGSAEKAGQAIDR